MSTIRKIKSRKMAWAGHGSDKVYNILVENPAWKRPLGRPRRR
jgi:hypothetical protein